MSPSLRVKWNHIVFWHAVLCLLFRNMPDLLNFRLPLSLALLKTCQTTIWFHFSSACQFCRTVHAYRKRCGVFLMSQKPAFLEGSLMPMKKIRFDAANGLYFIHVEAFRKTGFCYLGNSSKR